MKNFTKILSLVLALAMVFSCLSAFAVMAEDDEDEGEQEIVTDFSDVDKNSTIGTAVTELALQGIVTGYPDGTYLPEGNVTRAEFAVICARLANLANGIGTDAVTHFADLDGDDSYKWARPYVAMAVGHGIINGFEDGTFRAGDPVTYEQAVKMLMCLKGWQTACEEETKKLQSININTSWSAGYIAYANQQGLLKNTNNNSAYLSQPINRGVVAILAYNALSLSEMEKVVNPITNEEVYIVSKKGGGSDTPTNSTTKTVSGTITATYITALDNAVTDLSKYEIMIDDDIYEVNRKVLDKYNLCDLIGQRVKVTYDKKADEITAISLNPYTTKEVYTGVSGTRSFFVDVVDGAIQYCTNVEKYKLAKLSLPKNASVIFNGKYVDDFEVEDLVDPNSPYYFTNGMIEVIDGKTDVVKINNYKTYVVKNTSRGSSGTERINLLYKTGSEASLDFRSEANSGEYFKFSRSGKDITSLSDLSAYDVISVMESPEDAAGTNVTIMEATRNNKTSLKINGVNQDDENIIEANGVYYTYNYDYRMYDPNLGNEDKHILERGDEGVSIYLDYMGQIAHVAVSTTSSNTAYKYGYLFSMSQDKDEFATEDAKYNMELYLMLEDGRKVQLGTATTIYLDGVKYSSKNEAIADKLRDSAEEANAAYLNSDEGSDVSDITYQQPIRYRLNSSGLISAIDTVVEDDDADALECSVPYGGKKSYTSSSGFSDFTVSTKTKIFFIPDDRSNWDEYRLMSSSTFTSGRKYYVEAYNVAKSTIGSIKRAEFVLLYKTNDSEELNYKSPFLIVSNTGRNKNDEDTVSGYNCSGSSVGTTTTTFVVDTDKVDTNLLDNLHRGDIVRYIRSSSGQITKMERWFDASNPTQGEAVSSVSEALENRILAIRSTSDTPEKGDYAAATFRLAYGTVLDVDTDENILLVSPTLHKDIDNDLEMVTTGAGVVAHKFSVSTTSPVKVFVYNGSRLGAEYISENGMSGIRPYSEYGEDADIVITYSTGDTTSSANYLRFVYFVNR